MRLVVALLALALVPTFSPAASAGVDQCSYPPMPVTQKLPLGALIVGSAAWQDGSCGGRGVVGAPGTCASGAGQLCVGYRSAGAVVVCQWNTITGSSVAGLAVGTDASGDGNVWANNDPFLFLDRPLLVPFQSNPRTFAFNTFASGMVIAYPVSTIAGGSPLDITQVTCI